MDNWSLKFLMRRQNKTSAEVTRMNFCSGLSVTQMAPGRSAINGKPVVANKHYGLAGHHCMTTRTKSDNMEFGKMAACECRVSSSGSLWSNSSGFP